MYICMVVVVVVLVVVFVLFVCLWLRKEKAISRTSRSIRQVSGQA